MFQIFNNIPAVTKNILIVNILFYIASMVLTKGDLDLFSLLGAHYINSPLFEPYQIITHFFMHAPDFFHILFNMIMLVMFGAHLERIWGGKRFFVFYIASAIGAFALYNGIGVFQIMELKSQLIQNGYDITELNSNLINQRYNDIPILTVESADLIRNYNTKIMVPMVGASGAIFGIMAAFAFLFPNTELMLLFPPIPIKAKFLIGGYFVLEVFLSLKETAGDNIAHLAHVGGAIVGFILVYIWNKDKKRFY
ncbi:MAG: rhomboid family intramembrane serine protease [Bacteroidota bacterium]